MLSGKDGVFDKVRGKLVGATEYITKPFEPRDLLRVVQMMSDKQNLNAQDHFPVPYTVIVSAGAAAPTIKNWLGGAKRGSTCNTGMN